MKTFLKIIRAFLILSLAVSLSACAPSQLQEKSYDTDYAKDMKRITFISPQVDYPVWLQAKAGFEAAAKEFGFWGEWVGSNNCDLDEMTRQFNIALAENVDAIICCPLSPSKFNTLFEQALEKGINVITVAVDATSVSYRDAFIGSDYQKLGLEQAEALHAAAGDSMRIGVIMSTLDSQNQILQVNELRNYIANLPDCRIVATAEDYANPVIGLSVLSEMLDAHPDINAIFVTSGDAVSSYGKILSEKKLQDSIVLIGMDAIEDNLASIKNGDIYGVMNQDFYQIGYLSGKYALEATSGQEIPDITYTDAYLVTKSNVDSVPVIDILGES